MQSFLSIVDAVGEYQIVFTGEAKVDLTFYKAHERKRIVKGIRIQLSYQPLEETRNKKRLRDNVPVRWELRVGKFRVFYEVMESTVCILAVGHKEHNMLLIRRKEVVI